jgi:hypothetical protein
MIDQVTRITTMVKDEIKKLAIGKGLDSDRLGFHITESMVPIPRNGQQAMEMTWIVTLTYRLALLGSDKPTLMFPVVVSTPAPGFMPPDAAFRGSVEMALSKLDEMQTEVMRQVESQPLPTMGETMPLPSR